MEFAYGMDTMCRSTQTVNACLPANQPASRASLPVGQGPSGCRVLALSSEAETRVTEMG